MDLQQNIIIINGVNKTYQVESIKLDGYKYAVKYHNSDRIYTYSSEKITWLTHPKQLSLENTIVYANGKRVTQIKGMLLFALNGKKYYAITNHRDFTRHFPENEIDFRYSCLTGNAGRVFDYLRQCAGINTLGIDEDDDSSVGILSSIYSAIDYVDNTTAAAIYLDPSIKIRQYRIGTPIFPFGCNASQEKAVNNALSNQISVIQGPPGTGKTQTILNIIANLLVAEKSVLIVSNNNSATENVLEKLSKNGLAFLVAPLGKKENKETFIANQPAINPEISVWHRTNKELKIATDTSAACIQKLKTIFELQERLATCRHELAEVKTEKTHYDLEHSDKYIDSEVKVSSRRIFKISQQIRKFAIKYHDNPDGLLKYFRHFIDRLNLELHLRFIFKITDRLTSESIPLIISELDHFFYNRRIQELENEINQIENRLSQLDSKTLMDSMTRHSMTILKASLATRYQSERTPIESVKELFNNGDRVLADYPIVLSTTFSSRSCFNSDTIFDYVIMDEASQVSVDTGLLALTCARNAVIVGDTMQLPNVVTDDDRKKLNEIQQRYDIPEAYHAATHSFLSSILDAIPDIPETLLREHYRCHPDIINFCNQKFYGGNLLIMTSRSDDEKHLLSLTTVAGQHCRGNYNQREIDAVKLEMMPLIDNPRETGIIAPYNNQVNQFIRQIPEIEAATVHKYQGREKDTIIMSVTDDTITEFTDNANLLNVAVSRAKNKFCLVVTGNPQPLKGNIHDLVRYIHYQQGVIIQSKLRSIFDYLFSRMQEYDREINTVSDYTSENLTFDLIEKIRRSYPSLSHIKAICHYPMRYLIRDTSGLSEREIRYVSHPSTHIDFLIINRVSKEPLLAIETDGYSFHNEETEQFQRDRLKDKILDLFGLPLLRLSTVGHSEEPRIVEALSHNTAASTSTIKSAYS